ncbi:MAG: hypothetical protein R3Y11_09415 [Pseudomonadota bacterium]
MTKTQSNQTIGLDLNRKFFLVIVGASLITMLVGSFVYRLNNPALVVDGRPQVSMAEQGPSDMDNVGMMMQRLQGQPNDIEALLFLGEHFLGHESWEQAGHFLQRAVVAAPQEQRPLYLLGISQYHATKYADAAASFERLLTLHDDPAARYNLGLLYLHYLHDKAQAEVHLNAVMNNPDAMEDLRAMAKDALATPSDTHEDQ